jgi:hypothetical protein
MEETTKQDHASLPNQDTNECRCDFKFPVVVEDGRHLTISWNLVDDLESVASCFANKHSIPSAELPSIKCFLEHVVTMSEGAADQKHKQDAD